MKVDVSFRRKNFREAADSGLLLWRENFVSFIPFFAIPLWVCAFSLRIFLPENLQYYSWLIVWLLKPLFDRLILHVVSIRFFERDAGLKRLCRGLVKNLWRGLIGDLLWRRFSPLRSAMMPIRVLEKNIKSRKANRERKGYLKNGGIDYCFLLTIWGIAVEIALLIGEILFVITMSEFLAKGLLSSIESFADIEIYIYAAWCFNFILVETIYVCMGFSLYINSRIAVEGWDIEILFRGFAEKLKNSGKTIAIIALLLVTCFMPVPAFADETPIASLQTILESPDFGGEKDSWGIKLKKPLEQMDMPNINTDFIEELRKIFAIILRFILIIIIAGLLVLLFYYLSKLRTKKPGKTKRSAASILQKKPIEDPKILLGKAIKFHERGETRLAWGYCTAAAIWSWPTYQGIVFPPNATESDCASLVISKANNNSQAHTFNKIIKHWVYFAYAGKLPPEGSFEEAINLCKNLGAGNG